MFWKSRQNQKQQLRVHGGKNITADVGGNVILTCKVPNNNNNNKPTTTVEWSRPELDPEYVLRCQYGHLDPHNQHPSFENRVDLQDKEMKDGDVSLILMNVTKNDTGTYHCRVFQETKNEPTCNINLEVVEPSEFVLRVQFMTSEHGNCEPVIFKCF
uniref:Ig-like domain-containing protein n=1 Tax=Acanthochromis polyacanthus TaxID=80966 RepID=A0A3Q1EVU8_9TELE